MSKGKPLGDCKTCGSEIVEMMNDGVFRRGECSACERLRYESQPSLLRALEILDACVRMGSMKDAYPGSNTEQTVSRAIRNAHGTLA